MSTIPQFGEPSGSYLDRPGAYAVIINDGNLLCLLVHGRFFLPGGGIDPDEDPEEAVKREILEETGYTTTSLEEIGKANQFLPNASQGPMNKLATFYKATVDATLPAQGQEADHIPRWISIDEFLNSAAHDFYKWAVQQAV